MNIKDAIKFLEKNHCYIYRNYDNTFNLNRHNTQGNGLLDLQNNISEQDVVDYAYCVAEENKNA